MKNIFKKNQIIITALALMIAAAGYLSYTYSGIGDEGLTQTSAGLTEDDTSTDDTNTDDTKADNTGDDKAEGKKSDKKTKKDDAKATDGDAVSAESGENEIDNPGETVLTSTSVSNVDFAVEAKLNREQVRSQNKENLMEVINSTALSDTEKQEAVDKMVSLTDIAQRESDAEMLLEAKGFTDVVVSITDDAADVVLNMGDVTDAKRAQIEDIVKRKTKVSAENIVITPITTGTKGEK